jgi:hypothetical protein
MSRASPRIYCGNNALDPRLLDGTYIIGRRYDCLRKGVGIGLHMPLDPAFSMPYAQIVPDKIYCGNADVCPDEYDRLGTLHGCVQKGVGVGRSIIAKRAGGAPPPPPPPHYSKKSPRGAPPSRYSKKSPSNLSSKSSKGPAPQPTRTKGSPPQPTSSKGPAPQPTRTKGSPPKQSSTSIYPSIVQGNVQREKIYATKQFGARSSPVKRTLTRIETVGTIATIMSLLGATKKEVSNYIKSSETNYTSSKPTFPKSRLLSTLPVKTQR